MKKRKRLIDQRGQMIAAVVCLSFLLGTAGGALTLKIIADVNPTDILRNRNAAPEKNSPSDIQPPSQIIRSYFRYFQNIGRNYLSTWREGEGKRALKRERRRKQTEYCILFGFSVLLLLAAAGLERVALIG